ncbi:MAG: A/G-specific adenine glycosylase [Clostridiales bacterium]|nr:A/G-specific adenine glycosylase [Clostridiales bacterium]
MNTFDVFPFEALPELLLPWYERNRRDLPWRKTKEPYRVWISEIMLQQTRVEAVLGYYDRFLAALPDIAALASAEDDALMKLWEGLGYYSRARNLKKAARQIMSAHGGTFPGEYDAIRALPGIGDYTAGAIASICFNMPTPAIDGNVLRVCARLANSDADILLPATKKALEAPLKAAYGKGRCGDITQALMELGATVCIPNGAPLCESCPLSSLCRAKAAGTAEKLPIRIKKTKRKEEYLTAFLFTAPDGRIALTKREEKGLLAGLYALPSLSGTLSEAAAAKAAEELGAKPERLVSALQYDHVFTHITWHVTCYRFEVAPPGENAPFLFAKPGEYALPTAFMKGLRLI